MTTTARHLEVSFWTKGDAEQFILYVSRFHSDAKCHLVGATYNEVAIYGGDFREIKKAASGHVGFRKAATYRN